MKRIFTTLLYLMLPELLASMLIAWQCASLLQLELGGAPEHALVSDGAYRLVDIYLRRPWVQRETLRALLLFGSLSLALRPLFEAAFVRAYHGGKLRSGALVLSNIAMWVLQGVLVGFYVLLTQLLEHKLDAVASPRLYYGGLAIPFAFAACVVMVLRDLVLVHLGHVTATHALTSSVRALSVPLIARTWLPRAAVGILLLAIAVRLPLVGVPLIALRLASTLGKAWLRGDWLLAAATFVRPGATFPSERDSDPLAQAQRE